MRTMATASRLSLVAFWCVVEGWGEGTGVGTEVGARVMITTVGASTPIKSPPKEDASESSKASELRPVTTEAAKSVGEAELVAAREITISKEIAQA